MQISLLTKPEKDTGRRLYRSSRQPCNSRISFAMIASVLDQAGFRSVRDDLVIIIHP
jgi:hypothetical protein